MRELQRKCGCGGSCGTCAKKEKLRRSPLTTSRDQSTVPPLVHDVLRSPGQPLDARTRGQMESRFEHDFSRVRVHTDGRAAESAQAVAARAYTVGDHIVFNRAAYDPRSRSGQHLLAHELTHTVQQAGTPSSPAASLEIGPGDSPHEVEADRVANAVVSGSAVPRVTGAGAAIARVPQEPAPADPAAPQPQQAPPPRQSAPARGLGWNRCGAAREAARRTAGSLRVTGFDDTTAGPHISAIAVAINPNAYSTVSLTWANVPAGVTVASSFRGSPGAGKCRMRNPDTRRLQDLDCSDATQSTWNDSLCTPIGNHVVEGFSCSLGGSRNARMVTWFQRRRGIAFHYYNDVPAHPASHGCVRLDPAQEGAEWIHDNALPGVTSVSVTRAAGNPGPKCYTGGVIQDRAGYVAPTAPQQGPAAPQDADTTGDGP